MNKISYISLVLIVLVSATLTYAMPSQIQITNTAGTENEFRFNITNTNNNTLDYTITIKEGNASYWVIMTNDYGQTTKQQSFTLYPNQTKSIFFEFNSPYGTTPGNYSFIISSETQTTYEQTEVIMTIIKPSMSINPIIWLNTEVILPNGMEVKIFEILLAVLIIIGTITVLIILYTRLKE
jgi:hypothetical protein